VSQMRALQTCEECITCVDAVGHLATGPARHLLTQSDCTSALSAVAGMAVSAVVL
jgi:hypothetical protein